MLPWKLVRRCEFEKKKIWCEFRDLRFWTIEEKDGGNFDQVKNKKLEGDVNQASAFMCFYFLFI